MQPSGGGASPRSLYHLSSSFQKYKYKNKYKNIQTVLRRITITQAKLQFRMALGGGGRLELVPTDWVTRNMSAEVATFIERCALHAL